MENIKCAADFSIAQLIDYMADAGAQKGHMERITVFQAGRGMLPRPKRLERGCKPRPAQTDLNN